MYVSKNTLLDNLERAVHNLNNLLTAQRPELEEAREESDQKAQELKYTVGENDIDSFCEPLQLASHGKTRFFCKCQCFAFLQTISCLSY